MTDKNLRELLRQHALKLLENVSRPECDVRTMVEQARQTLGLAEAEWAEHERREPVEIGKALSL